eukprot:TRINITY_DN78385_c0_g1_i1.p1 TRINITY_DN78385_c0_g1~~TRINITY_DN78385_c0_g1_i1.p1  ORF type:complete len:501 (-),score=82.76 TRINITY_DN78385_c0_g1_i1:112-1614(-)
MGQQVAFFPCDPCRSFEGELVTTTEPECPALPPGGKLTAMMFGMTGVGKSALGNLLVGGNVFDSADDTFSVTNMGSVKSYETNDSSLVVLDTIGLGDTSIDQDKVTASIRDVALSAPNGIDAMLFVMQLGRITDDTISRVIYLTECLWGSECLSNLYVVVTFSYRYMVSAEEAEDWIERQVTSNWRFEHIYKLVDKNPNRFIFVDIPDGDDGLSEWNRRLSYRNIMRALVNHPRDAIPPFTHALTKQVGSVAKDAMRKVRFANVEIHELKKELQQPTSDNVDAEKLKQEIVEKEQEVKRALEEALHEVQQDPVFHEMAAQQLEKASETFRERYASRVGQAMQACKRLLSSLASRLSVGKDKAARAKAQTSAAVETKDSQVPLGDTNLSLEDVEKMVDELLDKCVRSLQGCPSDIFQNLDTTSLGKLGPRTFQSFVATLVPGITMFQIGKLWRRGDVNCDGQLDCSEFCRLFKQSPNEEDDLRPGIHVKEYPTPMGLPWNA